MWCSDDVRAPSPTAALFVRTFELRHRPERAVAKICGDRQYVLWVNGQPAMTGHNRPRFALDVVPVTDLLTAGTNLLVIEARSPTSVGAVLFALDLYPTVAGRRAGDPRGRNAVVSGPDWRVVMHWGDPGDPALAGSGERPWIWGRPPDHPWTYPPPVVHARPLVQAFVADPVRVPRQRFRSVPGGWVCRLDGRFDGYVWLHPGPGPVTDARLAVRYGEPETLPEPLDSLPVVALAGQQQWLYPGFVSGDTLVVTGPAPPEWAELVEALPP
jgi:hypothetical protein